MIPKETAYLVRFFAVNAPTERCEALFADRWRAEAFRDSCPDLLDARVIVLYELDEAR